MLPIVFMASNKNFFQEFFFAQHFVLFGTTLLNFAFFFPSYDCYSNLKKSPGLIGYRQKNLLGGGGGPFQGLKKKPFPTKFRRDFVFGKKTRFPFLNKFFSKFFKKNLVQEKLGFVGAKNEFFLVIR